MLLQAGGFKKQVFSKYWRLKSAFFSIVSRDKKKAYSLASFLISMYRLSDSSISSEWIQEQVISKVSKFMSLFSNWLVEFMSELSKTQAILEVRPG